MKYNFNLYGVSYSNCGQIAHSGNASAVNLFELSSYIKITVMYSSNTRWTGWLKQHLICGPLPAGGSISRKQRPKKVKRLHPQLRLTFYLVIQNIRKQHLCMKKDLLFKNSFCISEWVEWVTSKFLFLKHICSKNM